MGFGFTTGIGHHGGKTMEYTKNPLMCHIFPSMGFDNGIH